MLDQVAVVARPQGTQTAVQAQHQPLFIGVLRRLQAEQQRAREAMMAAAARADQAGMASAAQAVRRLSEQQRQVMARAAVVERQRSRTALLAALEAQD